MTKQQDRLPDKVNEQLQFIQRSGELRTVNKLLTWVMGRQKIQALIKDANLSIICGCIIDLALIGDGVEEENCLLASAILGRLSAVARGRESVVFNRLDELFEKRPLSIETLSESDEKYYSSLAISKLKKPWLVDYCLEEAVRIDTSEKARRILFATALDKSGSLTNFWQQNQHIYSILKNIENNDARYKRLRRVTSAVSETIRAWEGGEVGESPGLALADWCGGLMRSNTNGVEEDVLADILDDMLMMLLRIIELRFSYALLAQTYAMLDKIRTSMGRSLWSNVIRSSKYMDKVRVCLKETALVLARQNRTDKEIMDVLCSAYYSRAQVQPAITAHFSMAQEIEPDVKAWWEQGGAVRESQRERTHKIGGSEDQQIGSLLINVEESKTVMEKLDRAIVPFLEIADPPFAETVKKAARSYGDIAVATKQLAAMRKLQRMDQKGMVLEYNPLQHDMLGGHKLGIRKVKVVRDGVQKNFGGKIKILVKPRVTLLEE